MKRIKINDKHPTIRKYCRFPYFQEFGKFNHKSGIGLSKNVIYSTIFKQVLQEKKWKHVDTKKTRVIFLKIILRNKVYP